MAESLPCEQRSRWKSRQISVACNRINNEPLSNSLLGHEKETNEFNSRFDKLDGTSFFQTTDKAKVVTSAVLEHSINVTTGRMAVHTLTRATNSPGEEKRKEEPTHVQYWLWRKTRHACELKNRADRRTCTCTTHAHPYTRGSSAHVQTRGPAGPTRRPSYAKR